MRRTPECRDADPAEGNAERRARRVRDDPVLVCRHTSVLYTVTPSRPTQHAPRRASRPVLFADCGCIKHCRGARAAARRHFEPHAQAVFDRRGVISLCDRVPRRLCPTLTESCRHKPLRQLSAKTPRGTKIIVENVEVRHGLLMLTSVVVLGASGNDALESMGSSTLSTTIPTSSTTHRPEQRSTLPSSGLAVVVARAPTAGAPVIQPPSVPLPITPAAAPPQEPWDDASLSDEERATDPTVRHLFYGSPSSPTSSTTISTTRPPTKRTPVVHIGRVDSTIPSAVGGDPSKPFTYLSHTVGHVPSTWPTRRRVIKGFVKSVVSFEFQTGEYHLKVYVEDATRSILVSVESKFVESLMGVSCATFVQAMQADVPRGMHWVATMQHKLSVLEGLFTIEYAHSTTSSTTSTITQAASPARLPTLVTCQDATSTTTRLLLARLTMASS
ncbi:hypothetical protein H257_14584 [Aphanomyces astaci]|uniref:RecQ-mediated genome instability protein 1 C-terminal OB-fold domain-containing protein n=1 Tax=Aphanomyces astaci TaxID=112090 RepID=W4FS02_APHAT|nr:hypothetical protein H257_14584 [Aphanomyces astaci]ETV69736.1 hypothetical protein H257_14584 [Aphanomyces astaci]|eukprot:XP_009840750.1 hypothetical protein H257_14584 [Aphanomyces astaci]